ncbi:MAG: ParB/RepB/Spo0J family partition protein [Patescibacteria group bacterium]|jgi:ParB family chromosome partitioning protein
MYQLREVDKIQEVVDLICSGEQLKGGPLAMDIKYNPGGFIIQGMRFSSSRSPDVADLTSSKDNLGELVKLLINSKGKCRFTTGDGNGGLIQWRLQNHLGKETFKPSPPILKTKQLVIPKKTPINPETTPAGPIEPKTIAETVKQDMVSKLLVKTKVLGYKRILVKEIRPYANQPRKFFDSSRIDGLAGSLKQGQRQDIIVMELKNDKDYKYELVDGERRWRSALKAGVKYLDAKILAYMDEKQHFLYSAVSNFGREGHTEFEEAETLARIRQDYGLTEMELATIFAKSQSWVYQRLSLFKLDQRIQEMLRPQEGKRSLDFSVAQLLTKVPDKEKQFKLAEEIIKKGLSHNQANNLIRFRGHQEGFAVGSRKRTPRDDYRNLQNFLRRAQADGGVFIDMPEEMFTSMFKQRNFSEIEGTEVDIKKVIKLMQDLLDRMLKL